jgi:hypothetical protein
MEVPLTTIVERFLFAGMPSSFQSEVMETPGAKRSTQEPKFEKVARRSLAPQNRALP